MILISSNWNSNLPNKYTPSYIHSKCFHNTKYFIPFYNIKKSFLLSIKYTKYPISVYIFRVLLTLILRGSFLSELGYHSSKCYATQRQC